MTGMNLKGKLSSKHVSSVSIEAVQIVRTNVKGNEKFQQEIIVSPEGHPLLETLAGKGASAVEVQPSLSCDP